MSIKERRITIQTNYWRFKFETPVSQVYYGNEKVLIDRLKRKLKKQFDEYEDMVYMIDKLELHLHLPEIHYAKIDFFR